jgi:hypothetical protein
MKPRLGSAPWTDDDEKIWADLIQRSRVRSADGLCNLCFRSEESDRRDAALMLWAQEVAQFGEAAIQLNGIDCRGWTQHEAPVWP